MTPREPREAYVQLGLHPSASLEEVHVAYHRLVQEFRQGPQDAAAVLLMNEHSDSYEFICAHSPERSIYHPPDVPADTSPVIPRILPVPGLSAPAEPDTGEEWMPGVATAHWSPWLRAPALNRYVANRAMGFYVARLLLSALALGLGLAYLGVWYLGDPGAEAAYASAPVCTAATAVPGSDPNCLDLEHAVVSAQQVTLTWPLIGAYPDSVSLTISNDELQIAGAATVNAPNDQSLSDGGNVTITLWHGQVMQIVAGATSLSTDSAPAVIANRHLAIGIIWLIVAALISAKPLFWTVVDWRRHRQAGA